MRPERCAPSAMRAWTCASTPTSVATARPPIACATAPAPAASRSATTTPRAPSRAKRRQSARPIPLAPPAPTATGLSSFIGRSLSPRPAAGAGEEPDARRGERRVREPWRGGGGEPPGQGQRAGRDEGRVVARRERRAKPRPARPPRAPGAERQRDPREREHDRRGGEREAALD